MVSAEIDQWTPSDSIWSALQASTSGAVHQMLAGSTLGLDLTMASATRGGEVRGIEIEDALGVAFTAAAPHTDMDFDRYFALFVMQGPGTTRLESWNTRQEEKIFNDIYALDPLPKVAPNASTLLKPGDLVVFDGHRVHRAVVDPAEKTLVNALRQIEADRFVREESSLEAAKKSRLLRDPGDVNRLVTVCLSMEFKRKPTRELVEAAFLKHLDLKAPMAYQTAMAAVQMAATPRRRMKP